MRTTLRRNALAASLTSLLITSCPLWAGQAQPVADLGLAATSQVAHVTVALKLRNQDALESFIQQTVTPGNPNYQNFLSTAEFAQRFGASDADLAKVQTFLAKQGLKGTVLANRMAIQVDGTLGQFSSAFRTPIHSYVAKEDGRRFHRPAGALIMPAELGDSLLTVTGLDTERTYRSLHVTAPKGAFVQQSFATLDKIAAGNPTASGKPGQYTVGDVANLYNINPLYARGINGRGTTVAIVTLTDFNIGDVQAYWDQIGLTTKPNRIVKIPIDGGGDLGDTTETALDVEQSGGLAPFADVRVYHAPNAGTGFTDAYMQAVVDNKADTISSSWGAAEAFNFAALNDANANNTDTTDVGNLRLFHQIFMEAAAQGQSVFSAAGDSGAYEITRELGTGTGPGQYSAPLTVLSPASDPYITAAGGTTLPVTLTNASGKVATVSTERAWSWDYLEALGYSRDQLFAIGGGGGVSMYWRRPFYQFITRGVVTSEKGQTLIYNDPAAGPQTVLKLPARFAGRNMPDISLNADPETGYFVYADGQARYNGGTSFVAPQLNGITALLTQSAGHRVGFLNPHLYLLQALFGYGKYSAFNDITTGNIWFYQGLPKYDQATGIGTLNVANLDKFIRAGF